MAGHSRAASLASSAMGIVRLPDRDLACLSNGIVVSVEVWRAGSRFPVLCSYLPGASVGASVTRVLVVGGLLPVLS